MKHLKLFEDLEDLEYIEDFNYENEETKEFLKKYIKYIDASELGTIVLLDILVEKLFDRLLPKSIFNTKNFRGTKFTYAKNNQANGKLEFYSLSWDDIEKVKKFIELIKSSQNVFPHQFGSRDDKIFLQFNISDLDKVIEELIILAETNKYNL
jgi:hypothetical protein